MKKVVIVISLATLLAASAPANWSAFNGDQQRSGRTSLVAPTNPTIRWAVDLKGEVITSPVIMNDGGIVVGSTWQDTKHPKRFINCVNPDGTFRWRYELPWYEDQVISTPAIGPNNEVYVGTADGFFYALSGDGNLLWRYQAQMPVHAHPIIGNDGTIYEYIDSKLTAFSPGGAILWQFDLGQNLPGGPSLATDGTIYAVSSNGVVAVNPDGTLKWRSWIPGGVAPPVVSPNGDVIVCDDFIAAINPLDGNHRWFINNGFGNASNFGAPAVDLNGNIYYTTYVYVFKFSPGGVQMWQKTLQGQNNFLGKSFSSIVFDGAGKIIFGMGTGKRWAIPVEKQVMIWNANSGGQLGSVDLPEATASSSPAIGPDSTLYIGCLDGKLYALR